MSDPIVLCPGCNEYRHRSWFRAGERTCRACQEANPEWLDSLARAVVKVQEAEARHKIAVKAEVTSILAGIKPPDLTGSTWRLLQMVDRGSTDEDIAALRRVTTEVAETMRYDAVGEIVALAERNLARHAAESTPEPGVHGRDQTAVSVD